MHAVHLRTGTLICLQVHMGKTLLDTCVVQQTTIRTLHKKERAMVCDIL